MCPLELPLPLGGVDVTQTFCSNQKCHALYAHRKQPKSFLAWNVGLICMLNTVFSPLAYAQWRKQPLTLCFETSIENLRYRWNTPKTVYHLKSSPIFHHSPDHYSQLVTGSCALILD